MIDVKTTRGGFLAGAAATAAGSLLRPQAAGAEPDVRGPWQPGIAEKVQSHALFVGFDLTPQATVAGLHTLLADLTGTAQALMAGERPPRRRSLAPGAPRDAGDAFGIGTARLTVTIGLGPGLFVRLPELAPRRPAALAELPAFRGEELEAAASGGDLLLQICADDQQVVSHAFRQLRPLVLGTARLRWTQAGFVSHPGSGAAPRNLFGQHDGTTNPEPGSARMRRGTLVGASDWTGGGSYLVLRKIRMDFPTWDRLTLNRQQRVLGRRRSDGAPLSGGGRDAPLDLGARSASGRLLIADDAHVRLAQGSDMLRRSYNYDYGTLTAHDGGDDHGGGGHEMGHAIFDAGLLFAAYVRDPQEQFVPVMQRLAENDAMHRFLSHTASAVFFLPRSPARGRPVGDGLV